jgi:hypothetical protein
MNGTLLLLFFIIVVVVVVVVVSCHRLFLPGTSLEPAMTAQRSGFKIHTAVLSVLCAMFQL